MYAGIPKSSVFSLSATRFAIIRVTIFSDDDNSLAKPAELPTTRDVDSSVEGKTASNDLFLEVEAELLLDEPELGPLRGASCLCGNASDGTATVDEMAGDSPLNEFNDDIPEIADEGIATAVGLIPSIDGAAEELAEETRAVPFARTGLRESRV